MMNIQKILIIGMTMLFACSGGSGQEAEIGSDRGNGILISGTVGYPQSGVIQLEKIENNQAVPMDTILLDNNQAFSHRVEIEEPGYFRLNFYNKQQVVMILNEDDIKVTVDGNTQSGFVEVSGSSDHDLIKKVQEVMQSFQSSPEMMQLNTDFGEAKNKGDMGRMEELRSQYLDMERENKSKVADMVRNSTSLAVIDLLRSGSVLDADQFFDVYEDVARNMIEKYPTMSHAIEFKAKVDNMRKLAVGQIAPEIELPNPDGELVKLSSLRGKYVLLDFWAKWCRPCRLENPNVVKMYKKYNERGFEVFGVSLDRNRSDWLQAIEEDGLHWTQVSDLKYWNSAAAKLYNVTGIPFALLLDKEGKIIGKNLRGKALENKLEEIFN